MSTTFDAPQSRNEAILQNMLGANNTLEEPQSRIEELLQDILEEGIGGGLPEVTSADNGKVLGVENGQWGAVDNLPVIEYRSNTQLCVFTAEQATYMKSGKPFIVNGMLVTLPSVDVDPLYEAVVIAGFRVMAGGFRFVTGTTGYFWDSYSGNGVSVNPAFLTYITIPAWHYGDSTLEGKTIIGTDVGTLRWGNPPSLLGYPVTGNVATQFAQIIAGAQMAVTTSSPVNWFIPFDTSDFLANISRDLVSNPVLAIQPQIGESYVLTLESVNQHNSAIVSVTFHGEFAVETFSGDTLTAFRTYPFDLTYTENAVSLHMEEREFTAIPGA